MHAYFNSSYNCRSFGRKRLIPVSLKGKMLMMMGYFVAFIVLCGISKIQPAIGLDLEVIESELESMNLLSCETDKCAVRIDDSLSYYACHCEASCLQTDTCCLDSPYFDVAKPQLQQACRSVNNGEAYFMVDRCPSSESLWESECRSEWNGEDDVMKIVPVTSLRTYATYKNYFCFRCHEITDEFFFWKVKLESNFTETKDGDEQSLTSLTYDRFQKTWMVAFGNEASPPHPVNLALEIPPEIKPLAKDCVLHLISNCSDKWSDAGMIEKCQGYMAIKNVVGGDETFTYRNAHCALCNFEDAEDVDCKVDIFRALDFDEKRPFSFSFLLDINQSSGDRVGLVKKCNDDHMWDPYARKCRKLTCVIPGYKIKHGKCSPP